MSLLNAPYLRFFIDLVSAPAASKMSKPSIAVGHSGKAKTFGAEMDLELPTKLIARKVVDLLSEKNSESLHEAVAVLEAFFANQPDRVARAYELAWLVVLKRGLSKPPAAPGPRKPSPEADWLALRASKAIEEGNVPQAFSLLRSANNGGARANLCRSVVFQLMRTLGKKDLITQICYGEDRFGLRSLTTVEIGRVKGSGLVVIRNPGSDFDRLKKRWNHEAGREKFDAGKIFLKNLDELKHDVANGAIEFCKVGDASPAFDRIDWKAYLEELSKRCEPESLCEAA